MTAVYHEKSIIRKLQECFLALFTVETAPTRKHLFHLMLSVMALNGFQSVKANFEHFIAELSPYRLKSYYFTLSHAKIDLDQWLLNLVKIALSLLPVDKTQPLVLAVDDTMVQKSGSHFEYRSTLFDHANHNGSSYLDGHCFVSMLLAVPVRLEGECRYISFPVGYRIWTKEKTKLEMAAELVKKAMQGIGTERMVFLCCDSWYPKGALLDVLKQFKKLKLICNVRSDTVLYDLPPEKTGKRGRPRKRGDKLSLADFMFSDVPDTGYQAAARSVLTNLLGTQPVLAIVTKSQSGNSRRLFLCTASPDDLRLFQIQFLEDSACAFAKADLLLSPLSIYSIRWRIEVSYYEQKTFWSLGTYMLRSGIGIERLTNLLTMVYSFMTLIPYLNPDFAQYKNCSPQQIRFLLGTQIRQELFLTAFVERLETTEIGHRCAAFIRSLPFVLLVSA